MVTKPKKTRVEAATVAPPRPDAVEPTGEASSAEDTGHSAVAASPPEVTIHVSAGMLGPDDAVIISVDEAGAVEAALAIAQKVEEKRRAVEAYEAAQAAPTSDRQLVAETDEAPQAVTLARPVGRPSLYSQELAADICSRLADGHSLREICSEDGMPDRVTVLRWVFTNDEFRNQYQRAREMQSETMADELKDIADNGTNDWMERHNSKGEFVGWMENGEAIKRSALRINTRQWIAERMQPKRWGAKKEITVQNPDGTPVGATAIDPRALTQEQREALADALRTAMQANAIDAEYEETT